MTTLRLAGGPQRGLYHDGPAERCPSCRSTMILTAENRWYCQWCGRTIDCVEGNRHEQVSPLSAAKRITSD
jgi:hypothetical protein